GAMPTGYSPAYVEAGWADWWESSRVAVADSSSTKPAYTIVIPPPNVTGSLHLGHALMAALEDALIRRHRMGGYETLWVPGVDHAGIATQAVVERKLSKP